jgi:hypothetical protein
MSSLPPSAAKPEAQAAAAVVLCQHGLFLPSPHPTDCGCVLAAAELKDYNFNSPPSRYQDNTAHFTQVIDWTSGSPRTPLCIGVPLLSTCDRRHVYSRHMHGISEPDQHVTHWPAQLYLQYAACEMHCCIAARMMLTQPFRRQQLPAMMVLCAAWVVDIIRASRSAAVGDECVTCSISYSCSTWRG